MNRTDHQQTPQQLARSLLIGFSLLGSVLWLLPAWRNGTGWDVPMTSRLIWALGFLLALACYVGGPVGTAVYRFFTALQHRVEQFLTTVCLALVYVLVLGPIALGMKLRNRDRLHLHRSGHEQTHWREADPPSTTDTCQRQF